MAWELKPFFPSSREILYRIMKFRMRYQRGLSWVADVKYILALAITLKVYNIPDFFIFPVSAVGLASIYILGYIDEHRGIWKQEQEFLASEINPVLSRMDKGVEKLLKSSKSSSR